MLDGDFAYERGRSSITRRVREDRVTDWARFLTIWERQPDGGWMIFPQRRAARPVNSSQEATRGVDEGGARPS